MVALKTKAKSNKPKSKDIMIGKRAKITQAQQYMILAVLGASLFLGAAIAVVLNSLNKISFSASVIAAQEQSIVSLSDAIKNIGICRSPSGKIYSDQELQSCSPDSITASDVPGTLKSNIIENMAANPALSSVPNTNNPDCVNPDTEENYTYKELEKKYNDADNDEELAKASELIETCSALRVIPDALPAYKNEEALLSSVDKIFRASGTEPESLTPAGEDYSEDEGWASFGTNLYTNPVNLTIESNAGTVNTLLDNVERSIRNLNINQAVIQWSGDNTINFEATATAYYMAPSNLTIVETSIKPGEKK